MRTSRANLLRTVGPGADAQVAGRLGAGSDVGGQVEELDLLVAAACAGGGWAFGRLWELLGPGVATYLRARGVRDADDVTSEVFLAAFTGIGRFSGDGAAFRAWLFTIAHHKGVDAHRRRGPHVDPFDPAGDVDGTAPWQGRARRSAEDEALDRVGSAEARRRLDGLTDDQRAVILLRVVADLSLVETAAVLGKPLGAVKALQHRALARLRAADSRARGVADDGPVSPGPGPAMGTVT
jgi:RNA polymerase sigma-70 factor (ECF subfamily)